MEGTKFSSSRSGCHLRAGLPRPLRRGRTALLRRGGRPRDPGHRLHLERVRPPEQRRTGRHLGQPGEPDGLVRRAATSARSLPPSTLTDADRGAARGHFRCLRPGRRAPGALAVQVRDQRGDARGRPRPTSTSPSRRRGSCATADPERMRTVLHVALQRVADAKTLLTPFLPRSSQAVHEMLGGTGDWSGMPRIEEVDEEGGSSYPVITGTLRRRRPLGVPAGRGGHAAGRPRPAVHQAGPVRGRRGNRPAWRRTDLLLMARS